MNELSITVLCVAVVFWAYGGFILFRRKWMVRIDIKNNKIEDVSRQKVQGAVRCVQCGRRLHKSHMFFVENGNLYCSTCGIPFCFCKEEGMHE